MKKASVRNISIACLILFLALLICLWLCISNDDILMIIVKSIYSVMLIIILVYVILQIRHYYVANIEFKEKEMVITDRNKYTKIPYVQIKNVQYVMRRVTDSKKGKGTQEKDIDSFRGYSPYYDLINEQDELLETIDLDLFNEEILNNNFLQRGIGVYSRTGFMKPVKRKMSGKAIDSLREYGISTVQTQDIKEYINYYNAMVHTENNKKSDIGKCFLGLGFFAFMIFLATGFFSFLIAGIICMIFSIGWKRKINLKLDMQITDEYKAGYVFWGKDGNEFIVFFENGEMKRKDISVSVQVHTPVLNDIIYCVINFSLDIVMIGQIKE